MNQSGPLCGCQYKAFLPAGVLIVERDKGACNSSMMPPWTLWHARVFSYTEGDVHTGDMYPFLNPEDAQRHLEGWAERKGWL